MANYKTLTILLSLVSVVLLLLLIFGGKETVYVCYDGTEQQDMNKCPTSPPLTITQKTADSAITTYSTSFARSRPGVIASVINVYRVNNTWQSDVTFANSKTGEFAQVTFSIDGKTSTISCLTGCEYLTQTEATNTTIN